MNTLQRIQRDLKAKIILMQTDILAKKMPELSYKECLLLILEEHGLNNTEAYRRLSQR